MIRASVQPDRSSTPATRPSCITADAVAHVEHLFHVAADHDDRHALARQARGAADRSRPSRRRRCRASARRRSSTLGPSASHLASTTFCWLPPLSVAVSTSIDGALTCNCPHTAATAARSRAPGDQPVRRVAVERRQRHVLADRELRRRGPPTADPRARGTRRAESASAGSRNRQSPRRRAPSCPASGGSMPKIACATSDRPAPTSPATPRISPRRPSNDTACCG